MRLKVKVPGELIIALISVLLGLLAGAVFMAVTGNNPFAGYTFLFKGGLMNIERIGNSLATATPLILTGLSVAFAFKTGLFNIGGIRPDVNRRTLRNLPWDLPWFCLKPLLLLLMLIAAIAGGAVWGLVPGFLKARFNVHEVVAHHY